MIPDDAPPTDWRREREINRLPSVETQLVAWIDAIQRGEAGRCITLKRNGFRLYVRRSFHLIDDADLMMLDIANVIIPEKFRGRGWFTAFRHLAECAHPWHATYYESVGNPRLREHLRTAGLTPDGERNFYALSPRKIE
jgi:hypothetical protein